MFPRQVRTPFPHPNAPGSWSHLFSNPAHLANLPVISLFPLPKLHHFCASLLSSPSRGTWIEIKLWFNCNPGGPGRPPHGGRGLKFVGAGNAVFRVRRRPPHGGRGLKYPSLSSVMGVDGSSPSRGTWIEMALPLCRLAHPLSSPSRGTWIEMFTYRFLVKFLSVVPLTGDVD